MQKDNMNLKDYIISQKKKKYKIIFILVIIAAVFVCVVLGFTIFGSKVESIYKAYSVLSNRPFNSRDQFPDPFEAIKKNGNDGYSIEFGLAGDYGDGSRSGPSDSDPGTGDDGNDGDGGDTGEDPHVGEGGDPKNPTDIPDITGTNYTEEQVRQDIASGKYTKEDVDYLTALVNEASGYLNNLAVVYTVLNRKAASGGSIKSIVTADGQYEGYDYSKVGNWTADKDLFNAAIAALRGDASTPIGNSRYFFGRCNGYDMWAEPGAGDVVNLGGNIFYQNYGYVHNKSTKARPAGSVIIYDVTKKTWNLQDKQKISL